MQNDRHNKYDGRTEYLNELGTYAVGMLFLLVIFMAAYLVPGPAHSEPLEGAESAVDALGYSVETQELIRAQEWYLAKVWPGDARHDRVEVLAPLVAFEAAHYSLDQFILMITLIEESSLRLNQVGRSDGELGLGQQHGQALRDSVQAVKARGIDPNSIHGQIARTAWVLHQGNLKCKDELGMVSRYLSGKCKSKSVRTQRKATKRLTRAAKLKIVSK